MKYDLSFTKLRSVSEGELPTFLWKACSELWPRRIPSWTAGERLEFDQAVPRGHRMVCSFVRFDSDILNGGIQHYIACCEAEADVLEGLETLELIGAAESAALLKDAISIYKRYGWPQAEDSPDLSADDEAALERIDTLRCNDESSYRDYALLDGYLRRHLEDCVYPK